MTHLQFIVVAAFAFLGFAFFLLLAIAIPDDQEHDE